MKTIKTTTPILLILVVFFACEPTTETALDASRQSELKAAQTKSSNISSISTNNSEQHRGLATLRRATAHYHDVDKAIEEGFVQALPCQERPEGEGGLGIPFINQERLDANIDLTEPEVLFYEPQKNGRLRLIGAEPVVPIALWTGEDPPSLFGHEFHRNDEAGLYGLHMWIWKHNPDGVLAFWHSDVSCRYAE